MHVKPGLAAVAGALLVLCVACQQAPAVTTLRGGTMATSYSVRIADPVTDGDALARDVQRVLDDIEANMSTYIDSSDVSRFNASASTDWFAVDRGTCDVVAIALAVSERSDGAFDITVGPLVDLWGFGPDGSISSPPGSDLVNAALDRTGYAKLFVDCERPAIRKELPELEIDLSAVAKGYATDAVADTLEAAGYANYLVEVGGEMRVRGSKPDGSRWRIGIEAPERERRDVFDALDLVDTAVATSGDYRNYFEKDGRYYSHTIDPRTGAPVTHATGAVTVLAPTAAEADATATALLVLGGDDGLAMAERENIAALFLIRTADGIEALATSRFTGLRDPAAHARDSE